MNITACLSSKEVEWGTPSQIYEPLNIEFHFMLDPCTTADNPLRTKYYFTKKENGLIQDWKGNAFVNPPYGRAIGLWVEKTVLEAYKWKTTNVLLIPARTDTIYFHKWLYQKAGIELRFLAGRIKFIGSSSHAAPFPSMIVIVRGEELHSTDTEGEYLNNKKHKSSAMRIIRRPIRRFSRTGSGKTH